MTRMEFARYLKELQDIEADVREKAQTEYAHDPRNAFANFERTAAEIPGLTREQVLWIFLKKHLDAIKAHMNGDDVEHRESIQGRINDARLYLALLGGMFAENKNISPNPHLERAAKEMESRIL